MLTFLSVAMQVFAARPRPTVVAQNILISKLECCLDPIKMADLIRGFKLRKMFVLACCVIGPLQSLRINDLLLCSKNPLLSILALSHEKEMELVYTSYSLTKIRANSASLAYAVNLTSLAYAIKNYLLLELIKIGPIVPQTRTFSSLLLYSIPKDGLLFYFCLLYFINVILSHSGSCFLQGLF